MSIDYNLMGGTLRKEKLGKVMIAETARSFVNTPCRPRVSGSN